MLSVKSEFRKWKHKIAEILLVSDGTRRQEKSCVGLFLFGKTAAENQDFTTMSNHRRDYCIRALNLAALDYNAESGTGTLIGTGTTGVARQGNRYVPQVITPTSRRGSCFVCCGQFFNVLLRFRGDAEELEQRYKSREIDKFLKKDKPTLRKQVRLCIYFFLGSLLSRNCKVSYWFLKIFELLGIIGYVVWIFTCEKNTIRSPD